MHPIVSQLGEILFAMTPANPVINTLYKVRDLIIGSIPTIIFLLLLWGLYTVLVYRPLGRVLEERYRKTEGAFEQAKIDIQAADQRTAEYEQRLREARASVFRALDERRNLATQIRAGAANEARATADKRVVEARAQIEQQVA